MSAAPTLTWEQYQQLPADKRSRPLTDAEFAALTRQQRIAAGLDEDDSGAPANFNGPVFPNPDHVRPQLDSDNNVPVTRLPNGVSFQKGNFSGPPPMDVSNPPATDVIPAMGRTVGAQMSAQPVTLDMSTAQPISAPVKLDMSTAQPIGATSSQQPKKSLYQQGRDAYDAAHGDVGSPGSSEGAGLRGSLSDWDEASFGEIGGGVKDILSGNVARGLHRIISGGGSMAMPAAALAAPAAPVATAASAAGGVVGGKLGQKGATALGATPDQAALAGDVGTIVGGVAGAGVAAGAKPALNTVGKTATAVGDSLDPDLVGLVSPRAAHALRLANKVGKVATKLGSDSVSEAAPELDATGENKPFAGGMDEAAPAKPAAQATPAAATPSAPAAKPATSQVLEQQLNNALGGKPLVPGVSLKNQPAAQATAAGKLPDGFTPVDSTALKGYKYDPAAQEFTALTNNGQTYTHGEVSPDQVAAFEGADSKGRAWSAAIKNSSPLVRKNGVPVKPATMGAQGGDVIPKSQAGMQSAESSSAPTPAAAEGKPETASDDLTDLLQQSLDQTNTAKGLKPGTPRFVYRARDVGEEGVPLQPNSHGQATSDFGQAIKYAEPGQRGAQQGQVVRIDLSELKPSDYVVNTHPDGAKWVRFTRPLSEDEVSHFAGASAPSQTSSQVH